MYRKAVSGMAVFYMILFIGFWCVTGMKIGLLKTEAQTDKIRQANMEITDFSASDQRIVSFWVLKRDTFRVEADEEDIEALLRIVEAEAGSEDEEGKILVANVVLNRVSDASFPDTIKEVVLQRSNGVAQFSPVGSGRYYTVEISEETYDAVERALSGEDLSEGALFFMSRRYAGAKGVKWFEDNLTFLFEHGGHEFYGY